MHKLPNDHIASAASSADERLTATLAASTVGASFNFDCQKQCWFIRRLPGAYQVTADGVEIVAEGPRSKLEAFERWLVKATTDTESFAAESGDGAGPKSVSYGAATGDLSTPGDIADLALFLASNQSRFITGEVICVDGGRQCLGAR